MGVESRFIIQECIMWFRQHENAKWHRFATHEQESLCRNVDRPLGYVRAEQSGEAKHGQRVGAPPLGEPMCSACAKLSGFRRRAPRRTHIEQGELEDALKAVIKRVEALLSRVRGDVRPPD